MQGNRQHAGIAIEDCLRSIAVMHVPIDRGDALQTMGGLSVADRHADIPKKAKAHTHLRSGVMTWRPHQSVSVRHGALDHGIDGGDCTTRRKEGYLEAASPKRRGIAGVTAANRAHSLYVFDVGTGVNAADLIFCGGARVDDREVFEKAADLNKTAKAAFRFRGLVGCARLHAQSRREYASRSSCVVPHIEFVTKPTCCHLSTSESGRSRRVG